MVSSKKYRIFASRNKKIKILKVKDYINDGANWQAQAVLAYVRSHDSFGIEVTRYENCREQGYIFFLRKYDKSGMHQINVAVYEHRNSDFICIVVNDKKTFHDPINLDIWESMKDKYDVTKDFSCGEIVECGECIIDIFDEFVSEFA